MRTQHTPGPWMLRETGYKTHSFYVSAAYVNGKAPEGSVGAVAMIPPSTRRPMEANGRLIAAAPELLAALRALMPVMVSEGIDDCDEAKTARVAIAKATGAAA